LFFLQFAFLSLFIILCSACLVSLISYFRHLLTKSQLVKFEFIRSTAPRIIIAFEFSFVACYSILILRDRCPIRMTGAEWLVLLLLSSTDLLFNLIPFEILAAGFIIGIFHPNFEHIWFDSLIGFAAVFLILFTIYQLANWKYNKENLAFGFGDVLFCALIGWFAGFQNGLGAVAVGMITAGTVAGIAILGGARKDQSMPLAPFFTMGLIIYPYLFGGC